MKGTIKLLVLSFIAFMPVLLFGQNDDYTLVWSDEFNIDGLPDTTVWSYETGGGGWGLNQLQYYTANCKENARVEDGNLIIEARNEYHMGYHYTSARMITYDTKHYWKYGKIEARIKSPYGKGIWPAFWMEGKNKFEGDGWPQCGEIDIMEMVGGGEGYDDVNHGTTHWANASGEHASHGGQIQLESGILADDFHLYSVLWDEESIKWYFDDELYAQVDITPETLSEFHNDFFIILNVAVGGNWAGSPDETSVFPQQMKVDYIRVYQKGVETGSTSTEKKK